MAEQLGDLTRTHTCGALRPSDVGANVVLLGWVHRVRDLGGLLFVDAQNPRPFKRDLNNIQPRVGASYQMNTKTVLRGGYGISYLPTFDPSSANGFSTSTPLVSSVDGGPPPAGRSSPSATRWAPTATN
mgnify:CR=1 FL=1